MTVLHRQENVPTWHLRCDRCGHCTWHEDAAQAPEAPHICADCERTEDTSGKVDSGLAHERTTGHKWMYRRDVPDAADAVDRTPVHVWPASGGATLVLALAAFNARFIVDYRFDLERYNARAQEPPPAS